MDLEIITFTPNQERILSLLKLYKQSLAILHYRYVLFENPNYINVYLRECKLGLYHISIF